MRPEPRGRAIAHAIGNDHSDAADNAGNVRIADDTADARGGHPNPHIGTDSDYAIGASDLPGHPPRQGPRSASHNGSSHRVDI